MRNSTMKMISKLLCIVLIASFAMEAPLMAAYSSIKVNVGGESVNVTPGQWVTVNNGATSTQYNVRYVDGKPMALDLKQYTKIVFGGDTAAANAAASAQTAQTPTASIANADTSAVSTAKPSSSFLSKLGTKFKGLFKSKTTTTPSVEASSSSSKTTSKTGSFVKDELNSYGNDIKDSFNSGKTTGNEVGNKVYDGAKSGVKKVGTAVKSGGSKIGNLLKSAKDRIAKLFGKKTVDTKGTEQSTDSSQASQESSDSSQASQQSSEQSSQASQQSSEVSQSGTAAQTSVKADKPGFFSKLKTNTAAKFKSGYTAGKAMTNQGVDNVKTSLKSGFSAKNLLVTAGITVGVDFATQMMRGEKPSIKKAVKSVCSAEFAGGVVGSVTGAAAGSFFVPFLSAIPVVGGVLSALAPVFGSVVGSSVGAYTAGDLKNGRFSLKNAFKQVDWIGVSGQAIGSTAGAMLGSMIFPPFGTIIGGIAGGMLGNWAAHKLAGMFGKGTKSYGSIGMPVGTSSMSSVAGSVTGPVSIGAVAGSSEIPVAGNVQAPQVSIAGDAATMGSYDSEVQLAQAKYQELYTLYNEMLTQGRQEDAMKVAQEMNKAKAAYDTLKAEAGQ